MLALKVAALLLLMVVVLALTLRAKRMDFERFRTTHARRKIRVPIERAKDEGSEP